MMPSVRVLLGRFILLLLALDCDVFVSYALEPLSRSVRERTVGTGRSSARSSEVFDLPPADALFGEDEQDGAGGKARPMIDETTTNNEDVDLTIITSSKAK